MFHNFDLDNDFSVATSFDNLAGLYCSQGKYQEAEPLYQQALTIGDNLSLKSSCQVGLRNRREKKVR